MADYIQKLKSVLKGSTAIYVDASNLESSVREMWVNPKDIPEFSRRLGMMMFDPELIDSWKNWSKDYVKQFSYQKIVDGYENLYKKIVKVK